MLESQKEHFTARGLMKISEGKVICIMDDPTDSLVYLLQLLNDDSFDIQVRPTWCSDQAWLVDQPEAYVA